MISSLSKTVGRDRAIAQKKENRVARSQWQSEGFAGNAEPINVANESRNSQEVARAGRLVSQVDSITTNLSAFGDKMFYRQW